MFNIEHWNVNLTWHHLEEIDPAERSLNRWPSSGLHRKDCERFTRIEPSFSARFAR
jgi:hypothetical protein